MRPSSTVGGSGIRFESGWRTRTRYSRRAPNGSAEAVVRPKVSTRAGRGRGLQRQGLETSARHGLARAITTAQTPLYRFTSPSTNEFDHPEGAPIVEAAYIRRRTRATTKPECGWPGFSGLALNASSGGFWSHAELTSRETRLCNRRNWNCSNFIGLAKMSERGSRPKGLPARRTKAHFGHRRF